MQTKQKYKGLRLILGDQLNHEHSWFQEKDWLYVLMEVKPESEYVTHHIQKIVGIFQAMRCFAEELSAKGLDVVYYKIGDEHNQQSFEKNIHHLLKKNKLQVFQYQEADEWRLDQILGAIEGGESVSSEHFLTERDEFRGKKSFLMETFYRQMRKRHNILMDGPNPITGKWNYDKSNRKKLPAKLKVIEPIVFSHDVTEIYQEVQNAGIKSIGTIKPSEFIWPKNRKEVIEVLDYFVDHLLPNYGDYQDALSQNHWSVFHSRISFGMNLKMISPLIAIEKVEEAFLQREEVSISAAEGFIRQVLGWREYMRGLYWAKMPDYKDMNFFEHKRKLPDFFWTGETKMNCLSKAIGQSLDYAYAHHIQRLMVTGNFALLAGIDPDEVDLWYLGIYIDAFEWVEITNTRGMSQYADGGIVATKPYVSSASYIHKMGDYCANCQYDHKKKTGDGACPFNSLYWNFIDANRSKLEDNPRMSMMLALWRKMSPDKQKDLLSQAEHYLEQIESL